MTEKQPLIFFGAGAGRCGSMYLSNLLNAEEGLLTLHEGKIREREESLEQWIPFLTLENYQAYAKPELAQGIFQSKRKNVYDICEKEKLKGFGDIAYNNSPFVSVIPKVFPEARLIVLVRDGRNFVRSVYTSDRPDPTPVGWLDATTELTDLERYIAMGRLRPLKGSASFEEWKNYSPIEKNAWLWAETYRTVLKGVANSWSNDQVLFVKSETFFSETEQCYDEIRDFLGIDWPKTDKVEALLKDRINGRKSNKSYILPSHGDWDQTALDEFWRQSKDMMDYFGYS